jgi:2-iminoacetate synthase ThiH
MVVSVLRHFLPAEVRVRASWAALGWKVAQMALVHGADELAGWSVAESVAYSARVRAAARVETDEVKCGVEEAGKVWSPWLAVEEVAR